MLTEKTEILESLKKILSKFCKQLKVTRDSGKVYEIYCKKSVTVFNKQLDGMYFASAKILGGFVGFYFFPIYTHPKEFVNIPAEIRKCLKGKSCFHIKKLDKTLESQIKDMVKQGYDLYKKNGWV